MLIKGNEATKRYDCFMHERKHLEAARRLEFPEVWATGGRLPFGFARFGGSLCCKSCVWSWLDKSLLYQLLL